LKSFSRFRNKNTILSFSAIAIGILVNVILGFISYKLDLPVYWDTIGTIVVASVAGLFPGVLVGVVTNVICSIFNEYSIYFSIISAIIAILTVWFVKKNDNVNNKRSSRFIRNAAFFIAAVGAISGALSGVIQWFLLGRPENASIRAIMESMGYGREGMGFIIFIILNILLNIFDKAMCYSLATPIIHFIPPEIRKRIYDSSWKQKPLSDSERESIDEWSQNTKRSARRRMTFVLVVLTFAAALITASIGITQYFRMAKTDRTSNAVNAAKFAANVVDGDKIENYLATGEDTPGYKETEEMLYQIRENAPGVGYLYVLKVDRDKVTFVFDLDARTDYESYAYVEDTEGYAPGETEVIDDEFEEHMDDLISGKEIEPIESKGAWNWVVTAYSPIYDSAGHFVCYAGADASLDYMADYVQEFARQVLFVMAGIIVLILAYGIWTTNYYTVYPIEGIGIRVQKLTKAGDDQDKLDEAVRQMRNLDIRTEDEVEKLYHDICDMASNQTEQLRSIRRLSENTAQMQDGLIITMADLVENRDSDTGAHIQKTAAYVKIIVSGLKEKGYYAEKITSKFASDVVRSAPLHDVGKINIPDNVLNKPGKLTDEEYEIMKTHTTAGRKIMEKAISTVGGENYLKEARNMAAYHHERWDGKGYPEGLHGEVIPLSARIMAVADVFDALTSPRVYKPAFSIEKALSIIEEGKGTQFDPKCVEVFMESLDEVKVILKKYNKDA